jgi:hypothetical protein
MNTHRTRCGLSRVAIRLGLIVFLSACPASRLAAEYRIFWGDVHTHTSLSDGKGTPDQLLSCARDVAHLDFVILTDHDFGNGPPWRMSQAAWNQIQDKADQFTVEGKFVAIAGYEWTSQAKYWTGVGPKKPSERLFPGPPKFYNHKNVYFPAPVEYIFSAKDPAYHTPDLLAEAVRKHRGLVHNNHPFVLGDNETRDQWQYAPRHGAVIANTEMGPDTNRYKGKTYQLNWEQGLREFLDKGGKTGFVAGTDTHEGKPAARTAVLAERLTRQAIFEALRNRRNYAVTHARIALDFQINGHRMGEEIVTQEKPQIAVSVTGTTPIAEVAIIRDGSILKRLTPNERQVTYAYRDDSFQQSGYYYLRVVLSDADEHGNPSRAWSSPIWVTHKPATAEADKRSAADPAAESLNGYITSIPPESPEDRLARHKKIAQRRSGPIVIVHRGAWALAPENTLEAYAAAIDHGADGCEIDIRRTADGVLIMFHDDGLDRMTDALGPISQYTYAELSAVEFRSVYGAKPHTRIPPLAAVLELARQRAMLLHLDVKEPGLEKDIGDLLDVADVWDHVVSINQSHATELRKNPKARCLVYKPFGWQEGRMDLNPERVKDGLAKPGNMIMVDDPRVVAWKLKRKTLRVPLPDHLRAPWHPDLATAARLESAPNSTLPANLRSLARRFDSRSLDELAKLIAADFAERTDLQEETPYQQQRARRILERAWAAQQIGELGDSSPRAVQVLEKLVAERSLHHDSAYSGLDGGMAARALGKLGANESVSFLVRTCRAAAPELKNAVKPPPKYALASAAHRLEREILCALGELPCLESKRFLSAYVAADEVGGREITTLLFEEATRALLRQEVTPAELEDLLQSANSAVRGTAILVCLDGHAASRDSSLEKIIPWTRELPRAWK